MNNWIFIKDKLPELEKQVLVIYNKDNPVNCIGKYRVFHLCTGSNNWLGWHDEYMYHFELGDVDCWKEIE